MDGERLKKVRKERGYTQVSLAEALGVSKGSVAMWETGKRNPEFETLEELLTLLDVSYDYLTGRTDEEGYHNPTEEDKKQIAAWAIEEYILEDIKKYLALDDYGKEAVETLIASEYRRCRAQETLYDTSDYNVTINVKPDNILV